MASYPRNEVELQRISEPANPPAVTSNEVPIANDDREQLSASLYDESRSGFSLPRADGGRNAWLFLAACFLTEGFVWGLPFSFGVFQNYYSTHEFASESSSIAVIGTTSTGIMYLSGPLLFAVYQLWPHHRRMSAVVGLPLMMLSLVAASFATHVWHLILTQGVLYATGGSLLYYAALMFLEEWFVRRRGFAFGTMLAGTGVSGTTVPFIMSAGLNRWGFATMLRVWAIVLVALAGPLLYFVRPRVPVHSGTSRRAPRRFDLRFLKSHTFWVLQAPSVVQGLGYFMPTLYLPSFASAVGLGPTAGTLSVALFNGASVVGNLVVGSLIDRLPAPVVALLISAVAAASAFVIWGLAVSTPVLLVFSILYGVSAGGFSTTWPGMVREVQKHETGADGSIVLGLLGAGRGIGAIASGPLSEALIRLSAWQGHARFAYGTSYGPLIAFTGTTAAIGGTSWLARRVGWI